MTVCPFCKAPAPVAHGPCPRCGKLASDHPSVAGMSGQTLSSDFDDEPAPGLDLETGGPAAHAGYAAPSYGGGGVTLDDDDLLDDGPAPALELDLPNAPPRAPAPHAPAPAAPAPQAAGGGVAVPDLALDDVPRPKPARSGAPAAAAAANAVPAPPPPAPAHASGGHPAAPPHASSGAHAAGPYGSGGYPAAPPSSGGPAQQAPSAPPSKPSAAALVAKYPPVPTAVWEAPIYACKVLVRQFELRRDLESLRRRRSPDVPLYEAALRAHDPNMYVLGLALTCAGLAVATFIFFLPVILRFLRAPE